MNYYLAIDQGTHASRAILYDDNGKIVASESRDIHLYQYDNGHIEQDPSDILQSVEYVINKLLAKLPDKTRQSILSCGMACQRSTALICNPQGTALSPAISWQDTRGDDFLSNLSLSNQTIQGITGLPLSPHYSASKFRWLLNHNRRVRNTPVKARYLAPLISYLLLNLTEEKNFAVDHSQAQRTQLFNIQTLQWSKTLTEAFDIARENLPTVHPMRDNYGTLKNTGIPIRTLCGDQNAAALGINADDKNSALINLGSGAFILHSHPQPSATSKLLKSIAYSSPQQIRYCQEATVNGAGNALQWFHDYCITHATPLDDATYLADKDTWHTQIASWLASTPPAEENPMVFINSVGGLGSPWWLSDIDPYFYYPHADPIKALTSENMGSHAIAVIESIAFLLQDNLREMHKENPINSIKICGGLSKLDVLCQKIANLSQIPVLRIAETETTARGIAWLASRKTKHWPATIDNDFDVKEDKALRNRYRIFREQIQALAHNRGNE